MLYYISYLTKQSYRYFFIAKQGQRGKDVEQRAYVTQIIFGGPKTASFCDDHDEQKTQRPLPSEKTYSIVVFIEKPSHSFLEPQWHEVVTTTKWLFQIAAVTPASFLF